MTEKLETDRESESDNGTILKIKGGGGTDIQCDSDDRQATMNPLEQTQSDECYPVEKILQRRKSKEGNAQYLCKLENHSSGSNVWVDTCDLNEHVMKLNRWRILFELYKHLMVQSIKVHEMKRKIMNNESDQSSYR